MSSQHLHEVEAIADNLIFLSHGEPIFNDRRYRLGLDREENVFEFACRETVQEVTRALRLGTPVTISQDGLHFTLTVPLSVDANQVMKTLIDAGIKLHYFRDISRSTKSTKAPPSTSRPPRGAVTRTPSSSPSRPIPP